MIIHTVGHQTETSYNERRSGGGGGVRVTGGEGGYRRDGTEDQGHPWSIYGIIGNIPDPIVYVGGPGSHKHGLYQTLSYHSI